MPQCGADMTHVRVNANAWGDLDVPTYPCGLGQPASVLGLLGLHALGNK